LSKSQHKKPATVGGFSNNGSLFRITAVTS
jgi:hypothetical protein